MSVPALPGNIDSPAPWSSRSRLAASSSAELITASAPTASAFSRRAGIRSATTTWLTPSDLNAMVAPSPIGPAPKTSTLSDGLGWQRLTPWRATAIGSLRAATSNGMWSGTTWRLVPRTAFSIRRYSDRAPLAPPLPMMPPGAAIGLMTTWSPNAMPATLLPTSTISPAGSWPSGMPPSRPGVTPIRMKKASGQQIPHARVFTRTSAGPTVGFGASITWVSPGAVTTDTFMGTFLLRGNLVVAGDQRRDVAADDFGERAIAIGARRPVPHTFADVHPGEMG